MNKYVKALTRLSNHLDMECDYEVGGWAEDDFNLINEHFQALEIIKNRTELELLYDYVKNKYFIQIGFEMIEILKDEYELLQKVFTFSYN